MNGGKKQPSSTQKNVTEESIYTGLCHAQLYTKTAACCNLRLRTLTVSTENTGPIVRADNSADNQQLASRLVLSFVFFFQGLPVMLFVKPFESRSPFSTSTYIYEYAYHISFAYHLYQIF